MDFQKLSSTLDLDSLTQVVNVGETQTQDGRRNYPTQARNWKVITIQSAN